MPESKQLSRRSHRPLSGLILGCLALMAQPVAVAAQSDRVLAVEEPTVIRWWHGVAALGGLSVLMLLDVPAQQLVQQRRSPSSNGVATALRHFGQAEVFGTVTAGLVGVGLLSGNQELVRTGGRLATTIALAGAASSFGKLALGRRRPNQGSEADADEYVLFSGQEAMPSGHTTIAFGLATALADDIGRPWATVGLYTLASGVAWSRLNDDRHWLSDVAAGAAIGIASAKLVNGRWRIFNLRAPQILLGPTHAGIAWQVTF